MKNLKKNAENSLAKQILSIFLNLIFLVGLIFWYFQLRPVELGGPLSIVSISGTSMEPFLKSGDLVLTKSQRQYSNGDLILFKIDIQENEGKVIHRIVSGDEISGWITQGDNRTEPDPWKIKKENIYGAYWFHFPELGNKVIWAAENPLQFASLSALTSLIFLIPIRRKKISEKLAASLTVAAKEPSLLTQANSDYFIAGLAFAGSIVNGYFLLLKITNPDLDLKFNFAVNIGFAISVALLIFFLSRILFGFGVAEPNKTLYLFNGKLYLVDKFPILDDVFPVKSAKTMLKIADKYRLPILHRIDHERDRHEFLLITANKGNYSWTPKMRARNRLAEFLEDSKS